jgi:hypothetical protein
MCEQFVEEVLADEGVPRTRFSTAAAHGDALLTLGVLRPGEWPPGSVLVFGRSFDPDGHICIGDTFPYVITTYPGSVQRLDATVLHWYPNAGYLGYYIPDGVTEEDDMALPRNAVIDDGEIALAWTAFNVPLNAESAIYADWKQKVYAQGIPMGVPTRSEQDYTDRILQPFSSGLVAQYTKGDGKVVWLGSLA